MSTAAARSVMRDTTLFTGAQLFARALNFVYFILLARSLPADEFGVLSYLITIVVLVDLVIDLGLSRHAMREVARSPGRTAAFIRRILPWKMLSAMLALVATGVWATFIAADPTYSLIVVAGMLSILLMAPSMLLENVLQAHGRFAHVATAHFFLAGTQFIVGGAFLWFGAGTVAIALVYSLCNLVYVMVLLHGIAGLSVPIWTRLPGAADLRALLISVRQALPYLLSALVSILALRTEFIILGRFGTPTELGVFGMAVRLMEVALLPTIALATVMAPRFAKAHRSDREGITALYAPVFEYVLLGTIGAAIIGAAASPIVPWLLARDEFATLDAIFRWLLVGYPFAALFFLNISLLLGARRQARNLTIILSLSAGQIALNLFLQGRYGFDGALAAFVLFMAFTAVLTTAYGCAAYMRPGPILRGLFRPAVCLGLAAAASLADQVAIGQGQVWVAVAIYAGAAAYLYRREIRQAAGGLSRSVPTEQEHPGNG